MLLRSESKEKNNLLFLKLITATMLLFSIPNVKIYAPKMPLFANKSIDDAKFSKWYGENNIFVWDVYLYDDVALGYYINQNKLPNIEFINHNLPAYEWTYGQPYWNNYLNSIGLKNPARSLIERKNTYYVSNNPEKVMIYLKEHFGKDIVMKNVFDIDGIPVWEFIK